MHQGQCATDLRIADALEPADICFVEFGWYCRTASVSNDSDSLDITPDDARRPSTSSPAAKRADASIHSRDARDEHRSFNNLGERSEQRWL